MAPQIPTTRSLSPVVFGLGLGLAACGALPDRAKTGGADDPAPGTLIGDTGDTGAPDPGPPPGDYRSRGAHAVGHQQLAGPEGLAVDAWYPTASTAPAAITYAVAPKLPGLPAGPLAITGAAVADAAPDADQGPYPLVLLSHGFGLSPAWMAPLAEHLASHGMVVLAPDHPGSDWEAEVVASSLARPRALSAALDMAEDGLLDGIIDTDRTAVLGHSLGGAAALSLAGARIDTDALAARCAETTDAFAQAWLCAPFLDGAPALAAGLGLETVPAGPWPAQGDPRVDAVVALAGDAYLYGAAGLDAVTVPTMVLGGTADTGTPWDWGAGLTYAHVSSETRGMLALEGAEHLIFVTPCTTMPWTDALPAELAGWLCGDPVWDKADAHPIIHEATTAFLLHSLTADPAATAALAPARFATEPGVQLSFTGR